MLSGALAVRLASNLNMHVKVELLVIKIRALVEMQLARERHRVVKFRDLGPFLRRSNHSGERRHIQLSRQVNQAGDVFLDWE